MPKLDYFLLIHLVHFRHLHSTLCSQHLRRFSADKFPLASDILYVTSLLVCCVVFGISRTQQATANSANLSLLYSKARKYLLQYLLQYLLIKFKIKNFLKFVRVPIGNICYSDNLYPSTFACTSQLYGR